MTTQNKLYALLILTIAAMMTACGGGTTADDAGNGDSSSRAPQDSKIMIAACNQASSTSGTLKVNIEALYESGVLRPDLMGVKLNVMSTDFSNGTNYIQMWRWKVNSQNQASVDSVPVQFRLDSISTGAALTGYMTSMKWSDISGIATSLGVSTPAQLFNLVRFTVDVRDQSGEYDVLKVVSYNSSNSAVDQLDVLMPLFALTPADYAIQPDGSARPSILKNLHPFRSMTGSSVTQLTSLVNSYCF